ncbi:MAG: AIR synthase-related protein [Candidatus Thorarchaeota archaeon]
MDEGKLPISQLKEILNLRGYENDGVLEAGRIGGDVAIIDIEKGKIKAQEFYNNTSEIRVVVKSDPITFPTPKPGQYVVIVNSNDLACAGALPFGFLPTIIAPYGTSFNEIIKIQEQIHEQCLSYGITILGGHTEISKSVNSIIVSGNMIGFVPSDYSVPNELSHEDLVLAVGHIGAEGIGIIIEEAKDIVKTILSKREIEEGKRISSQIRIVDLALNLNKKFKPSLIHDATEGGIFGALTEIVAYREIGIDIKTRPAISPLIQKLAEWLKFDPYRLISSGLLIVGAEKKKAYKIINYLEKQHIPVTVIGEVIRSKGKIILEEKMLPPIIGDEIITVLEKLERMKNDN